MMNKLFHPEIYHGYNKKQPYFEGWYLKHVSSDLSTFLIVIPGISLSTDDSYAFIQIITGKPFESHFIRFEYDSFKYADNSFKVSIGKNHFNLDGIELALEEKDLTLHASIDYHGMQQLDRSIISPNIMGFFAYINFMQCYHGILSLNHTLSGSMTLNGINHQFENGKGYIEKDWGRSFPKKYLWLQCNHFDQDINLFCSLAHIPFLGKSFTGLIAVVSVKGKQYRFATYNGSKFSYKRISDNEIRLVIMRNHYKLEIHISYEKGNVLKAPIKGALHDEITETLTGQVLLNLWYQEDCMISSAGTCCAFEIVDFD